jgi:nucleoside-diphosphate-sugar epimerase
VSDALHETSARRRAYLVTGVLGAIGAWTARALLGRGTRVVGLDVGSGGHRLDLVLEPGERDGLELVRGDIADLDGLERLLVERGITNVVHLAALQVPFVRADPARGALVDVVGTVNVLEAARRAGIAAPVVYASSIAALGPAPGVPPLTLYGVFKRTNEETAVRYWEDYGVASIGLRPHTVYGPGRDQGLTSAATVAMLAAAAGVAYTIPFGGSLQFQYLPDVAEAFVRASELDGAGASVHTLDGPSTTVAEVVRLIGEASGAAAGSIGWSGDPLPFPGAADGASFVELLGGSVNRPLAEGVADTVERFRVLLARGLVAPPGES